MADAERLAVDQVAKIIEAQFPHLAPAHVITLGEGCDSAAFEVNGAFVFRFPKRADVEQQLLVEIQLLPCLTSFALIAIPAFCFFGQPSSDFRRHFVGYEKLVGIPAIHADSERLPFANLAPTLAKFLSWLHAFPITEASRSGVRKEDIGEVLEEIREEALAGFELLQTVTPDAPLDEWHAYLKSSASNLSLSPLPPRLLHNDLAAEHILLDATNQHVTGIIDWGDVAIGDVSVDFAGLYHWGGEDFVRAVLGFYDGLVDDQVLPRARYLAACRGVNDIRFGTETNQQEYIAAGIRALALTIGP
jgi:aminoglycoside phosphotransferase (APT) family kinase protein